MKIALAAALLTVAFHRSASAPLSGSWTFAFGPSLTDRYLIEPFDDSTCTLAQDDERISGECGSDAVVLMGAVKRNRVTLHIESDAAAVLTATVNADATKMDGTWRLRGRFGKFTASRTAAR